MLLLEVVAVWFVLATLAFVLAAGAVASGHAEDVAYGYDEDASSWSRPALRGLPRA